MVRDGHCRIYYYEIHCRGQALMAYDTLNDRTLCFARACI